MNNAEDSSTTALIWAPAFEAATAVQRIDSDSIVEQTNSGTMQACQCLRGMCTCVVARAGGGVCQVAVHTAAVCRTVCKASPAGHVAGAVWREPQSAATVGDAAGNPVARPPDRWLLGLVTVEVADLPAPGATPLLKSRSCFVQEQMPPLARTACLSDTDRTAPTYLPLAALMQTAVRVCTPPSQGLEQELQSDTLQ